MLRQRVEKGIGGGIVRLSRRTDQAKDRREEDEVVEFVPEGCAVKQPTSLYLRGGYCGEPAPIHLVEDPVVEHSSAMKDAPQRRHLGPYLAQNPIQVGLFCDVADSDDRADPLRFEGTDGLRRVALWADGDW